MEHPSPPARDSGLDLGARDVVIAGAGLGGLCMAIKLREAGNDDFIVFEKGHDVGGTWRDNTYPGAACDVRSHLYSYSFAGKADWSHRFAARDEIYAYITHTVETRGLRPFIACGEQVVEARFDIGSARWHVRTQSGCTVSARYFVLASGVVHLPHVPALPGLDTFQGKVFHSARWDHAYDLAGKRVAAIGTGASAVQYIPKIAEKVAELHVFQRSPGWLLPRANRRYSGLEKWLFARVGVLRWLHRARLYWTNEASLVPLLHGRLAKYVQRYARAFVRSQVHAPRLREALTPDYRFGCKRLLISSDYLPTFNRAHVQLVVEPISAVTADGIVTCDGVTRAVDCMIFGTGFVTDPRAYTAQLHCVGLGGRTLSDAWKDGASAYLGVTLPGFPNMFQLAGPNSVLAHNSLLLMIEAQVHYIVACMALCREKSADFMTLRPEVHAAFNEALQARFRGSVWADGCDSWYKQKTGHQFALWPGSAFRFWWRTRRVASAHYLWSRARPSGADDTHS